MLTRCSPYSALATCFFLAAAVLSACTAPVRQLDERELTAGIIQREIRRGMSGAEVVTALGSPNIVTRDESGRESWVYDRIASSAYYGSTSGSIGAAGLGGAERGRSLVVGLLGGSVAGSNAATVTTQRTLTVVIKFDSTGMVDSFSYHQTKF